MGESGLVSGFNIDCGGGGLFIIFGYLFYLVILDCMVCMVCMLLFNFVNYLFLLSCL
jgi:hypothetical protein